MTHLMIPISQIKLIPATIEDYPVVQNLARFYVYDRSGYMGWSCSEDGMFDCIDFKHYFEKEHEKAFLIKVNDELAGFVLLDKEHLLEPVDWNMGEFFVIAKFQGQGVASAIAQKVFKEYPGKWSVAVMPENLKAAKFWKKMISQASEGHYTEIFKTAEELRTQENPDPYSMNIFMFKNNENDVFHVYERIADWMDENRSRTLFEKPYLNKVISYLKSHAKILDLGCGTGEPIGHYFSQRGFTVTGVDSSTKMLEIAKKRCPNIKFLLGDMRKIDLNQKFDCIIAWHSFFHLSQEDQRKMFEKFAYFLNKEGILLFTSGPKAGEVWNDNGGQLLYHASLSVEEYENLLNKQGFKVIEHKISDPKCGGATVWLAKLEV